MIKEGRLANWAKRQGAAAERLGKAVSACAERQRRYRQRKVENARQGEFAFAGNSPRTRRPKSPSQAPH
jgi:hypothetical protein